MNAKNRRTTAAAHNQTKNNLTQSMIQLQFKSFIELELLVLFEVVLCEGVISGPLRRKKELTMEKI